jgi:cell wall-associated NlpC family hydrolase
MAAPAVIFALFWVMIPALEAAPKARPAWVIPETLNVRSGPRETSRKIGTLSRGTKVYVTAFANKWCWASLPGGEKGWIAEWLLQFSADKGRELAASAKPATATTTSKGSPPAWVGVTAANVRSGPGLGGKSYGTLSAGTKVYVLERKGEWVRVKTPGGAGWIRGDLLEYNISAGQKLAAAAGKAATAAKPAAATAATSAKAYVTGEKVILRSGPGSRFDRKATLVKGQTLYISGSQDQWRKVTVHGGASGWVAAWLIKQETQSSAPAVASSNGSAPEVARTDKVLSAWVTAETANVRHGPSSESKAKFQLKQGTKVQVAAVSGHWCKIRTASGNYGWLAGWLIKFVPPGQTITATEAGEKVEVNVGWVARPTVNLRSGPGTDTEAIGEASLGTRIIIIGKNADWYKVALEDGSIGWMSARLVDTRSERIRRKQVASSAGSSGSGSSISRASLNASARDFPSPTVTDPDEGAPSGEGGLGTNLVATARRFIGSNYVSGGSSPGGFDCSGFVSYVHRRHGISVSRSSRALFKQGSPVSRDDLQPGDVLFFERTYRSGISHVGLYLGSGKFIHAANHRGGVKITDVDSDYYASRYVGARRMY